VSKLLPGKTSPPTFSPKERRLRVFYYKGFERINVFLSDNNKIEYNLFASNRFVFVQVFLCRKDNSGNMEDSVWLLVKQKTFLKLHHVVRS